MNFTILYEQNPTFGNGHFSRTKVLVDYLKDRSISCRHVRIDEFDINEKIDLVVIDFASKKLIEKTAFNVRASFITTIEYYGNHISPDININTFEQFAGKRNYLNFTGLQFSLINNKFINHVNKSSIPPRLTNKNILIMIGGGKQKEYLNRVIDFTNLYFQNYRLNIVLNVMAEEVTVSSSNINVFHQPENLVELMANCTFAVVSPGVSSLELLFLGKASFLIPLNRYHIKFSDHLINSGISLGYINNFSFERRQNIHSLIDKIKEIGPKFIDGRGAERIINTILWKATG